MSLWQVFLDNFIVNIKVLLVVLTKIVISKVTNMLMVYHKAHTYVMFTTNTDSLKDSYVIFLSTKKFIFIFTKNRVFFKVSYYILYENNFDWVTMLIWCERITLSFWLVFLFDEMGVGEHGRIYEQWTEWVYRGYYAISALIYWRDRISC